MINCDFPQNIIDELGLHFPNGEPPLDFVPTLSYLVQKYGGEYADVLWRYYTTGVTFVELGAERGITPQWTNTRVSAVLDKLKTNESRRILELGLIEAVRAEDSAILIEAQDKLNSATALCEAERDNIYHCGYFDGFEDGQKLTKTSDKNAWERRKPITWKERKKTLKTSISYASDIRDIPNLGFSSRLYNVLLRGGITTVGEIMRKKPEQIKALPNMGERTYNELVDWLVNVMGESREDWVAETTHRKRTSDNS